MTGQAVLLVLFASLSLSLAAVLAPTPAPGPAPSFQRPQNADCFSNINSTSAAAGGVNYFPQRFSIGGTSVNTNNDRVTVTVATDYSVQYFDSYKLVNNLLVNESYALYQCGTPRPSSNSLPPGTKIFSVPLTSVALLETVPVAFMNQLGVMSRVQSVSSLSTTACAQKLLSCGKAAVDSLSLTASTLQNQVAPFADAAVVSTKFGNAPSSVAFSASSDPGPLNRAEWIKFLGTFFNLDAVATQTFNSINSSYYQTKASVTPASKLPVLAFIDLYTYPPDTAYEVSLAAYKVQYTKDAGASPPNITDILAINGTSLSPLDLTNSTVWFAWNSTTGGFGSKAEATAAFHRFLQGVDIVIDETFTADPIAYNYATFLGNMSLSASDNYTFLANKAVFREDGLVSPAPSYGLDWFEGAIARPDQVLQDFARAVNQTKFASHKPVWIRNIATGQNVTVLSSQDCTQISSCSAAPSPICPFVQACSNGNVTLQQGVNSTCSYEPCSS